MDTFFAMLHGMLGGVLEDLLIFGLIGVLASIGTLILFALWYGRER